MAPRSRPGVGPVRGALCALAALPLACAAPRAESPDGAPRAATIWQFVETKYDADGDGAVAPGEYDRGPATFERLDRDGDGRLTQADFPDDTSSPPMTASQEAMITVWRTFRSEGDLDLGRDELAANVAAADADGDGRISWAESRQVLPRGGPGSGPNRFGLLKQVLDADGDGALGADELLAFFDAVDEDGDGLLSPLGGRRPDDGPPEGARPGDRAPDFTLPDADTGHDVTLSDFRGERPVALIFGSYT